MALNLEEYRSGEDMNGFQYQSFLPSHINDRWIWDTRIGNTNGLLKCRGDNTFYFEGDLLCTFPVFREFSQPR